MAKPKWMKNIPCKDAEVPVTINIRQHHIDEAVASSATQCVVALCTLRALDAKHVWIYRSKAYVVWDDGQPIRRYQNSQDLIKRVINPLDSGHPELIQPGMYTLNVPTPAQALGRDRRAKNPGTRRKRIDRGHRMIGRLNASV